MASKKKPDPGQEFADIWAQALTSQRHHRLVTYSLGAAFFLLLLVVFRLSNVTARNRSSSASTMSAVPKRSHTRRSKRLPTPRTPPPSTSSTNSSPITTATADFDLVHFTLGAEVARDRWTASLQFHFLSAVPGALLPVNPLGLVITYIEADRAASF